MYTKPDQIIYEAFCFGIWSNLTLDVTDTTECSYGISGNSKTDRVADVGDLTFTLRNDSSCIGRVEDYYTPYSPNTKRGWTRGIPVRLKIKYKGDTVTKFYGHISDIDVDPDNKRVTVTCLDYMDYTTDYPLSLYSIDYDKKIGDVVNLIVNGMNQKPLNMEINTGQETFAYIFDTVHESAKALTEFQKLALSELGYIYVKRTPNGECLTVEGRYTRSASSQITKVPKNGTFLKTEDGKILTTENGKKIMVNLTQDASFDPSAVSVKQDYGANLANRIVLKTYPRRIDASPQVLYSLNTVTPIAPSETISSFIGYYKDPLNEATKITAKQMVDPVSGTDYQMWSNSDGTGTNLTANLSVTATYGVDGVNYTLTNTGLITGYITKLQARGYGIYFYDSLSYITEDSVSVNQNGYSELDLDMKYLNSPLSAKSIASVILRQTKDPKMVIESINIFANDSDLTMSGFLFVEPGSLVYIHEPRTYIDGYYYVQGIKFKIDGGQNISYSWNVVEALSLQENFWVLGTSKLGTETVLGY